MSKMRTLKNKKNNNNEILNNIVKNLVLIELEHATVFRESCLAVKDLFCDGEWLDLATNSSMLRQAGLECFDLPMRHGEHQTKCTNVDLFNVPFNMSASK